MPAGYEVDVGMGNGLSRDLSAVHTNIESFHKWILCMNLVLQGPDQFVRRRSLFEGQSVEVRRMTPRDDKVVSDRDRISISNGENWTVRQHNPFIIRSDTKGAAFQPLGSESLSEVGIIPIAL